MGSYVSLLCALLLLLLQYGREGAALTITSDATGNFLTGDNINLTISYISTKNVTVTWGLNTTTVAIWRTSGPPEVDASYRDRLSFFGNGSLLITKTTKNDNGIYAVTLTVLSEVPTSRNFQVTFYDPVKNVSVIQTPGTVSEGTPTVNLTCNATSGIETIRWMRDGQSVGDNQTYILLNGNRTLQINNPTRSSSGNYSCNISNPVSWGEASLALSVSYNPLSAGAIAGIVIASVLGAILLIALIVLLVFCIRRRKNGEKEKKPAGPHHKEVIRTVSETTLSPDDPAYFTLNNIMYRSSSISMGSYIMNSGDHSHEGNLNPTFNPPSIPPTVKHATQV